MTSSARIKYVVLAHHAPEQLARLVRRLTNDDASFFVHVDRHAPRAVYEAIRSGTADVPRTALVPRHNVVWGGYGIVRATLEGMRAAASDPEPFDFVVLLSGQDYPVRAVHEIHAWLAERKSTSFVNNFQVPNDRWVGDGGMDRFTHWHWRGRLFGRYQMFPHPRLPKIPTWRRRFLPGVVPYGGSMYWALPRDAVNYVLRFVESNRKFDRFFHHVAFPDESFFQTIMLNSPLAPSVVDESLHYIDWSEGGSRPKTLTEDDLDTVFASGKFFARKFDDMRVLDRIDERIR